MTAIVICGRLSSKITAESTSLCLKTLKMIYYSCFYHI